MENVGVLAKVADIMDLLSATREHLTMTEMSHRLEIPRPTLHRLLRSLQALEMLHLDEGRLCPGLRLVQWANEAWESSDLRRVVHPVLERVGREVGETTALFVRVGYQRICLDRVEGPGLLRTSTHVGETSPLHAGASGKILLAFSPSGEWQELWRVSQQRFPDHRSSPFPDLQTIREQGFVIAAGDRDEALSSASVPVFAVGGEVLAALSISGPGSRLPLERMRDLLPLLRRAAGEIGSQIGRRIGKTSV